MQCICTKLLTEKYEITAFHQIAWSHILLSSNSPHGGVFHNTNSYKRSSLHPQLLYPGQPLVQSAVHSQTSPGLPFLYKCIHCLASFSCMSLSLFFLFSVFLSVFMSILPPRSSCVRSISTGWNFSPLQSFLDTTFPFSETWFFFSSYLASPPPPSCIFIESICMGRGLWFVLSVWARGIAII